MSRTLKIAICRIGSVICLTGSLTASWAVAATPTDHFSVLSQAEAKHLALCSRPGPKVKGTWDPPVQDVLDLESKLGEIAKLKGDQNPNGQQIPHPESSFRQYLGVVVTGRNLI